MRSIYIFLTRTGSVVSKIVRFFTSDTYTHSAIAFDDELVYLYSSARWDGVKMFPAGPCREDLHRGFYAKDSSIPCAVYELKVTDEVYDRAKAEVDWFIKHKKEFKFNALGIAACKFGIAWNRKSKLFCSQFVSRVLRLSGAATPPKVDCLMRPSDYMTLDGVKLVFEGSIDQLLTKTGQKTATVS